MASSKAFTIAKEFFKACAIGNNFQRCAGGCRLLSVEDGRVKVEFEVKEEHTNPFGTLHGGCTASLVDIVTTAAILAKEGNTHPGVSVDLTVSYLAPAKIGETVVLDASVIKFGRSMAFTKAELHTTHGDRPRIIATALHTKAFAKR